MDSSNPAAQGAPSEAEPAQTAPAPGLPCLVLTNSRSAETKQRAQCVKCESRYEPDKLNLPSEKHPCGSLLLCVDLRGVMPFVPGFVGRSDRR